MGPELASTMMNLTPPTGWWDVASKHDLVELERRIDRRFENLELKIDATADRMRAEMLRSFGTWLFAGQAAVIAAVSALIAFG